MLHGGVFIVVGTLLFNVASRQIPAVAMSVFAQTEMLFVPIWALIVLSERPRPTSLIGGTIIFAAVIGKAVLDPRPVRASGRLTSAHDRPCAGSAHRLIGRIKPWTQTRRPSWATSSLSSRRPGTTVMAPAMATSSPTTRTSSTSAAPTCRVGDDRPGHQGIFDSIYKGSTVQYSVIETEPITEDCLLGMVHAELDVPSGPLQGSHQALITTLLVRDGERWKVRHFHNTLVTE